MNVAFVSPRILATNVESLLLSPNGSRLTAEGAPRGPHRPAHQYSLDDTPLGAILGTVPTFLYGISEGFQAPDEFALSASGQRDVSLSSPEVALPLRPHVVSKALRECKRNMPRIHHM